MSTTRNVILVLGTISAIALIMRAFNRLTTANASGVTTTSKSGLTTTPIQTSNVAFTADKLVTNLASIAKSTAQSAFSLVIPARTDALQPNGNPRSNYAAYSSPLQAKDRVSSWSDIQ